VHGVATVVIGLSVTLSQALLAQEEVPPGISRQDEIPGRGLRKDWKKGKHKGWSKEGPEGREDLRDDKKGELKSDIRDIREDKRGIREDTRDIRKDRNDIREDAREIKSDRPALKDAIQSGDKS